MASADICSVQRMDPGVIINRDMVHILDRHRSLTADEITCLAAMDREGKKRNLPLMTVSVAILELTAGDKRGSRSKIGPTSRPT